MTRPDRMPAGDVDRQALPRELVDDRQALQRAPVRAGIEHEVVRPDVIDRRRRQRPRATGGHASARPLLRHLQALLPPQPIHAVGAQRVALALEEDPDRAIAVPRILRGQRPHRRHDAAHRAR